MNADIVAGIVSDLKWPVIILVVLILFRRPLQSAVGRLTSLNIAAGDFKLETALQGHVSPQVIEQIRANPQKYPIRSEQREVTILRVETRGFTDLSESLTAVELSEYLRTYLTKMTEVIFDLHGTVDRYEGTSVTAYWGAPVSVENPERRACEASLRMQSLIKEELSPELEERNLPPLLPLFAITTAYVAVGDFGSEQRSNYSILGDYETVLQGLVRLNYNFQSNVLVTQYTHAHVKDHFEFQLLAERLRTKGKSEPISVFELLGEAPQETKR